MKPGSVQEAIAKVQAIMKGQPFAPIAFEEVTKEDFIPLKSKKTAFSNSALACLDREIIAYREQEAQKAEAKRKAQIEMKAEVNKAIQKVKMLFAEPAKPKPAAAKKAIPKTPTAFKKEIKFIEY